MRPSGGTLARKYISKNALQMPILWFSRGYCGMEGLSV